MGATKETIKAKGVKKMSRNEFLLDCINSGRYKIDIESGEIYTFRKGAWNICKPTVLPAGYKQYVLFRGKRDGQGYKAYYGHIIVWTSVNGLIPGGMVIDHENRVTGDNWLSNLRLTTPQGNVLYSLERPRTHSNGFRLIRGAEIDKIRELMNGGFNQSSISRQLDLNRNSVRYIWHRIKNGEKLKYEYK